MDDELLESIKALENARAELPRQSVDRYKESGGFKEGLKRMGRVTYEYGYRVALARFHALHLDSEVEEDPFTSHPEDDLVSMERQQAFDNSDPPEASFPRDRVGSLTSAFRSTRSPILTSRGSLYSNSNGVSVPESFIFFIAYHTAAPHHIIRGPCDETHACS
ncbi:hypothetical protein BHM03_00019184 [Ensete ventricosum]|nr:hypothetical protein BHM03_00019184 [Ensete ventricosum]